jgi:hypothetical protein
MSAGKGRHKSLKEHGQDRRSGVKRKLFLSLGILAGLAIVLAVLLVVKSGRETEWKSAAPAITPRAQEPNTQRLVGNWIRTDGGYIIAVRSIDPAGRVDAAYFNPRPINVSRAEAVVKGNTARLFIELRDEGYPGSTYTLEYDSTNDALTGVYFQAVMQQSFNVMFARLK